MKAESKLRLFVGTDHACSTGTMVLVCEVIVVSYLHYRVGDQCIGLQSVIGPLGNGQVFESLSIIWGSKHHTRELPFTNRMPGENSGKRFPSEYAKNLSLY